MDKPVPTCELAIASIDTINMLFTVWATPDAIEDLMQFGIAMPHPRHPDLWVITPDKRYDFKEILNWVDRYNIEHQDALNVYKEAMDEDTV